MSATATAETKLLSFDDIEKVEDIQYKTIEVPEWGGSLRLGSINAEDMIEFVESNDGPAKKTAGLRLIIKSVVNDRGERIGNDKFLQMLKKRNSATCNRIVDEILKLNGLDVKQQQNAKND